MNVVRLPLAAALALALWFACCNPGAGSSPAPASPAFAAEPRVPVAAANSSRAGAGAAGSAGHSVAGASGQVSAAVSDTEDACDGGVDSASQQDCALRGQQCYGRACCSGHGSCELTSTMQGSTWACGGVVAGGFDTQCLAAPALMHCAWTLLSGCVSYGKIEAFCPAGAAVKQLKRCDGSCFEPDALYQQYAVCSCDAVPKPGVATCGCNGSSWAAVLCCPQQ